MNSHTEYGSKTQQENQQWKCITNAGTKKENAGSVGLNRLISDLVTAALEKREYRTTNTNSNTNSNTLLFDWTVWQPGGIRGVGQGEPNSRNRPSLNRRVQENQPHKDAFTSNSHTSSTVKLYS